MPDNPQLEELFERWDDLRHQGREVSAEELCQDHPELLADLKRRIHALQAMNWLLESDSSAGEDGSSQQSKGWKQLPRSLGRYELKEMIGSGGFGQVWLGYDPQLKRRVAIKVPRPDRLVSADRFLEEAQKVAQLRHPGIVPVYDVGRDGDWCFIVSDYIHGGNLSQRFKHTHPPWQEAVALVIQVADILDYAHKEGYIHRDIKPANILVDQNGKPYLTDFGIAVSPAELGHQVTAAGTLAFMSPEQLQEATPSLDVRTDIYALGVVLYWLTAGQLPYVGESETELRTAILQGKPLSLKTLDATIPDELEGICARTLAKEPSSRFSTACELANALRLIQKPNRRLRPVIVTLGVMVVLAVLACVWIWPLTTERITQDRHELTPEVVEELRRYADTHPGKPFQPDTSDVQRVLNESLGRLNGTTKATLRDAHDKIKEVSPGAAKQIPRVPIPRFSFPNDKPRESPSK